MKRLVYISFLLVTIMLVVCCTSEKSERGVVTSTLASNSDDEELREFEENVYKLRVDLLSNRTYDPANIPVADSIYAESEKRGSVFGKMMALQLKTYVYVADTAKGKEFLETVDEFLELSKSSEDYEAYYDGLSVKVHYYIGKRQYMAALSMVREILQEAEKSNEQVGLYFCNSTIGNIYLDRGNSRMALPYFQKAFENAAGDSIKTCIVAMDLSNVYANIDDYEQSYHYALLSREYATSEVYSHWTEAQCLQVRFMMGTSDEEYLQEWKESFLHDSNSDGILPEYTQTLLKVYEQTCNHRWEEAVKLAETIEFDNVRLYILSEVYKRMGDYKHLYQIQEHIVDYRDSVQTAVQTEDLSEMDTQLGNSQLKLESQELKARNQKIIYGAIIIILVLMLVGGLYIIKRHRDHLRALKQKNEELDKARTEAERASHVKTIFINNMTHELHTPLNHIYGFAQVLSDDNIPSSERERHEMAKAICESSEHLTRILDNVVEVSAKLENMTELSEVESVLK